MATFSFGSFGDIMALASLTITCARSLSDSTGSASDFRDFIDELQSLKDDLDNVAAHLPTAMDTANPSPSSSFPDYSRRAIEQCHMAMEVFHNNVKKYGNRLNGNGPKSWFYKILWAIWKKDQITDFRLKFARHRHAISMLQFALQNAQLSRIAAVVDVPPSVKNTPANSIEFVDAVGTSMFLHINWCSTWKMLDALVKARFCDAPFGEFVQDGEYNISRNGGKTIIRPQEWARVVQAGMVVEMSVVLKQGRFDRKKICPICGYLNSDGSPRAGWIDW
ncbi:hypothetical protein BD410DRAFT_846332 [Rickenella mellea]|uniref:Ubiquitin-like domain-containing protein n=1 Tax=Rickenella mellea TaxID=50990 RepID=A0A4Y7PHU5_9AGAM|nr:hypothetical protein BD410DRAFT_846332 [Rickenella mellea]